MKISAISDIVKILLSIDPIYIITGFILYLCTYFFRALRFHILLNDKINSYLRKKLWG